MQTNSIDPSLPSTANSSLNPSLPLALSPAMAAEAQPVLPNHVMFPIGSPMHRRTRSEFILRFPDEFGLNSGEAMVTGSFEEIGSEDDLFSTYMDIEKIGCKLEGSGSGSEDGVGRDRVAESSGGGQERRTDNAGSGGAASMLKTKHRHSNSVDGSSVSSAAGTKGEVVFGEVLEAKKAMTPEQLAELAAIDPKRAKRILANRQSAARSKERKARYISELEKKVQTLQTEATTLSAQLTFYQRDANGLATENTELKLRLQRMQQQAQARDAMNDNLKNEVERLKIITGETTSSGEANKAIPIPLSFNPSFFPTPQPPTSLPHQPIHLPSPFHPPQYAAAAAAAATASYFPMFSYSQLLGAPIPHDHLGRLQRSDITKAALRIKAESCSSLSAGESSSNF